MTMKEMYVPPEIVREIFLNLPCKSLYRFRCISKEYKSHVDDPRFVEEHRKHNMKASHLLFWDNINASNLHIFKLGMDGSSHIKTIPTYTYKFAYQSSYGMVCLQRRDSKKIALFNSLSEEIIPLPDVPNRYPWDCCLGFGFDPKSRRYKIVQIGVDEEHQTISRFHTLTVTRNDSSWRTVDMSGKSLACSCCYFPFCVDGVLYWEAFRRDRFGYHAYVLAFDLGTEEIKCIEPPAKWSWPNGNERVFSSMEGKVCCYHMSSPTCLPSTLDIWNLDYDSNNNAIWILRYNFEIYDLSFKKTLIFPLFVYDGKMLLFKSNFATDFYCYDIKGKSMKSYPLVGIGEAEYIELGLFVHSETLTVPID